MVLPWTPRGLDERLKHKPTLQNVQNTLFELPHTFASETGWCYGLGLDVLGFAISRATRKSLGKVMEDYIFNPLGMSETGFEIRVGQRSRMATLYRSEKDGSLTEIHGDRAAVPLKQNTVPGAEANPWGGSGLFPTPKDWSHLRVPENSKILSRTPGNSETQ